MTALNQFQLNTDLGIFQHPDVPYISYSDGSESEQYLKSVFKQVNDLSSLSGEPEAHIKDWPSQYHLSRRRTNVLRFLDFKGTESVLEIGCGTGIITRYLAEQSHKVDAIEGAIKRAELAALRCRDLTNVKVHAGDINKISSSDKMYDRVTLIGVLEYAASFIKNVAGDVSKTSTDLKHVDFPLTDGVKSSLLLLEKAKQFLKPDGQLIIAIENRMGLKYLSGCSEDHTGKMYEGIYNYPSSEVAVTYSKPELEKLLKESGFNHVKFYYPFPDYKIPNIIFSDHAKVAAEKNRYLHNFILSESNEDYIHPRHYNINERLLQKELFQNGLFEDFANSFVVVASIEKPEKTSENWVFKKYNVESQKSESHTEVIYEPHGILKKKQLTTNSIETCQHPIIGKKSLYESLLESLFSDKPEEKFLHFCQQWYKSITDSSLQTDKRSSENSTLPCLNGKDPHDLFLTENEPINCQPEFVIFHGLLDFFGREYPWIFPLKNLFDQEPQSITIKDLLFKVCVLLCDQNFSEENLAQYLQQEIDFQNSRYAYDHLYLQAKIEATLNTRISSKFVKENITSPQLIQSEVSQNSTHEKLAELAAIKNSRSFRFIEKLKQGILYKIYKCFV